MLVTDASPQDIEDRAKACGLSVNTMCERAGIHRATWQRFKAGKHGLNSRSLDKLVEVVSSAEAHAPQSSGGEAA